MFMNIQWLNRNKMPSKAHFSSLTGAPRLPVFSQFPSTLCKSRHKRKIELDSLAKSTFLQKKALLKSDN